MEKEEEIRALRYILKLLFDVVNVGRELTKIGSAGVSPQVDPFVLAYVVALVGLVQGRESVYLRDATAARLTSLGYDIAEDMEEEAIRWEIDEAFARGEE